MYLEIKTAEIICGKAHTFQFGNKVQQFMAGFSELSLEYGGDDHHVKEITIDLTDASASGQNVVVQPRLQMADSSNHQQKADTSKIRVVVAALTGSEDSQLYMQSALSPGESNPLAFDHLKFLNAALVYSQVAYPSDHHVKEYASQINALEPAKGYYKLDGSVLMRDKGDNRGSGTVKGGVIAYCGTSDKIMCGAFVQNDTEDNPQKVQVALGSKPNGFNSGDYQAGYFINSYSLSFSDKDHHVKKISLSVTNDGQLFEENNMIYVKLKLSATIKDNSGHTTNLPHNTLKGFVLACPNSQE